MLSIPHLIIIFLVALVVFGPQKLPELARTLGRVMAEFRKATGDLRSTFDEHMRELEREAQLHDLRQRDEERGARKCSASGAVESAGQMWMRLRLGLYDGDCACFADSISLLLHG